MPILGQVTAIEPAALTILVLIGISLLVIWPATLLSRRGIVGPVRIGEDESLVGLFGILLLGCFVGLLIAIAFRPVVRLPTARRIDVLNAMMELAGLCTFLIFTKELRPAGLKRLGLSMANFPKGIALAIWAAAAVFPLVYAASVLVELIIELRHGPMPKPHPLLQQLGASHSYGWMALVIFEATVLAPLFEETLFRGYLQSLIGHTVQRLRGGNSPPRSSRWIAVVLTAAIFGAVHGEAAFFLPLFVLAIGLGYLYERTGNLWSNIFLHAFFNAMQIALFLNMPGVK